MRDKRIAVVAFDGISPFHLAVPGLVFGEVSSSEGGADWSTYVCAVGGGAFRTSDGYTIAGTAGIDTLRSADIVVVPSWTDPAVPVDEALCEAVRAAHRDGAIVIGLCLGAFVVAAAGLLSGRSAVTHWRATEALRSAHPDIDVDPAVLYIDHGDVMTSAGTGASLDACLHVVRTHLGAKVANQVARSLVVAPHRDGGQAQYIEAPLPRSTNDNPVSRAMDHALRNLGTPLSVEDLADIAGMGKRNFSRVFQRANGDTPAHWLTARRLDQARTLLEGTSMSVEQIATECGFGSAVTLRQNFAAAFRMSPSSYRRNFALRRQPSS